MRDDLRDLTVPSDAGEPVYPDDRGRIIRSAGAGGRYRFQPGHRTVRDCAQSRPDAVSPEATYHHEFRIGGGADATSTFTIPDAAPERLVYHSHYLDIVADRRIVFSYTSIVNEVPRWTSLVTVLLEDDEIGCLLTWTEQVAFLTRTGDGSADLPHLRGGTTLRLNGLAAALQTDQ